MPQIQISESTINIALGGAIASFFPLISLWNENRKWKRESKINYLVRQKQELKDLYQKTLKGLHAAMKKGAFDADMITDFLNIFPKNVTIAFWKMVEEKNKKAFKKDYLSIVGEMKKSLSEIDTKIMNEFNYNSLRHYFSAVASATRRFRRFILKKINKPSQVV